MSNETRYWQQRRIFTASPLPLPCRLRFLIALAIAAWVTSGLLTW